MIKQAAIAFLGLSSFGIQSASAQQNYTGVSLDFLDVSGSVHDISYTVAKARIGKKLNNNISGELRFGLGIKGEEIAYESGPFGGNAKSKGDVDNLVGAYIRAGAAVSESVYPYAIIGVTRFKTSSTFEEYNEQNELVYTDSSSATESEVSFGLGLDVALNKTLALNLEYIKYDEQQSVRLDGTAIGLAYSF